MKLLPSIVILGLIYHGFANAQNIADLALGLSTDEINAVTSFVKGLLICSSNTDREILKQRTEEMAKSLVSLEFNKNQGVYICFIFRTISRITFWVIHLNNATKVFSVDYTCS